MRSFVFVTILTTAYACGSNRGTNFTDPNPVSGGAAGAGNNGGGVTGGGTGGDTMGGSSAGPNGGGGSTAGTSGTSGTGGNLGDAGAGAGAAPNAGAGGDEGDAGAGGAGGSPPEEACPGTLTGCVIDWAGTFGTLSDESQDGVGQAAVFGDADGDPNLGLRGITGDGTYIYTAGSNCIRRTEIATATVETIAGQCGVEGYDNDTGTSALFGFVDGIATDGTTLWVVDAGNAVIRAIDLDSLVVTRLTGTPGSPAYDDDNNPNNVNFDAPRGLVYQDGYLYVTEQTMNAVRRINPDTGAVTTVAGPSLDGDLDGQGDDAAFRGPRKISGDGMDLYVADTENHLLRQIVLGGGNSATNTVGTVAGDKTGATNTPGWVDATGTAAKFNEPRGITFDGDSLIVADFLNCAIRHVTLPTAVVTTIAGAVEDPCTHAVGVGTDARFNRPMDLHYDPGTGDLFILEDSVIRRMYYK